VPERELERGENANPEAHHVALLEPGGEHRAVPLVHWNLTERDAIRERIKPVWDGVFVNAVLGLE
jgi:hypothetical protein